MSETTSGDNVKKIKKWPWVVGVIILAVVFIVCAIYIFMKNGTGGVSFGTFAADFQQTGQPVMVNLVLDASRQSSALLGPEGGTLSLTNGAVTLTLPKDALPTKQDISMTAMNTMQGLPAGWKLVDGYNFGPSGIIFSEPVTFSEKFQSVGSGLYAFVIENGQMERVPYTQNGNQLNVGLDGFSGVAFIQISGQVPYISNSHVIEQRAVEILANIAYSDYQSHPDQGLSESAKNQMVKILQIWYSTSVKPHLQDGIDDPAKLKDAGREYVHWLSEAMLFGLEGRVANQVAEGKGLLVEGLKKAIAAADEKCVKDKDATQVANILQWENLAMTLGVDDQPGLRSSDIVNILKKCARFELDFQTSFDQPSSNTHVSASGKAQLVLNDEMELSGTGTITEESMTDGGIPCTGGALGKPIVFKVPPMPLSAVGGSSPGATISLLIDLDQLEGTKSTYRCTKQSNDVMNTISYGSGPFWLWEWDGAHGEPVDLVDRCTCDRISNWQYVGSGDIFAQKIYDRETPDAMHEHSVLTLKLIPE